MTLDEKVDMLHGELNNSYGFYNAPIERLGIPALKMTDGRNGVRVANDEVPGKRSTLLPSAVSVAASWDTDIAAYASEVETDETYLTGQNMVLAPSLNIARVPQNGRNFESYGEDPLLQGKLGGAYVRTTQNYGGVIGNLQDWAVYTQEFNRLEGLNAVVDERAQQEIYNRAYDLAIEESHAASVMCGFNKVNGEYSCGSDYLINQVLKTQYEFNGWVVTDYGANHGTLEILAGQDQEMPGNSDPSQQPGTCAFCGPLIDAVNDGTVPISRVDDAVLRILRPMFGLGVFDNPQEIQPLPEEEHNLASAEISEQGIVLLKNDDQALPLGSGVDSIAVIGSDADTVVQGGGSSHIADPTITTSPLQGIQNRAGSGADVTWTSGSDPVTSTALLRGAQPIPSDFLRDESGANGLTARYYLNQDFSGTPYFDRTDPYAGLNGGFVIFDGLNANSPHFPPQTQALDTNSSVRWSGSIVAPVTGAYELQVVTNGVTTLNFDGADVITTEAFVPNATESNQIVSYSVDLEAGSTHPVVLSYVYDSSEAWNQSAQQIKLGWVPPEGVVAPQATGAAEAAAAADVAVVFVRDYSTEGADLATIELPNGQPDVIRQVAAANPRTIVVLTTGAATQVSDWQDGVAGLVHSWYGGQNQGTSIARILFGDVNPSGKLPITLPVDDTQTPTSTPAQYPGDGLDAEYTEGIFVGYRGYQELGIEPSYPFGYGLSYTSFAYSDLRIACKTWNVTNPDSGSGGHQKSADPDEANARSSHLNGGGDRGDDWGKDNGKGKGKDKGWGWGKGGGKKDKNCKQGLTATVKITNTGRRTGSEVVQAYAGELTSAPVATAPKSLAGWGKVTLRPRQSQVVTLELDQDAFSYWDVDGDRWVTPSGDVPVYVGPSSQDTPLVGTVRIRSRS
ncbi:beta-glucosidase family protein [Cellulomonas timonensis]|uniref:beta-glucosidase family protein n=1 Tax=Cellulomonas timonensis TaxID=1689271 RepID=UPI00131AB1FB|nr:glycoside hydrolase family 3 C-terminal domain-containing protein [Cellulomonas timonensis]